MLTCTFAAARLGRAGRRYSDIALTGACTTHARVYVAGSRPRHRIRTPPLTAPVWRAWAAPGNVSRFTEGLNCKVVAIAPPHSGSPAHPNPSHDHTAHATKAHKPPQPRLHRANTCAHSSRQVSALLSPPPARWPDLPALQPLHSLTHSASPTRRRALARSDGRKLARPSLTARCPQGPNLVASLLARLEPSSDSGSR